ncbi:MAG: indole-3-glycerol phosphate synthase TrpC [Dehalococcoidia bacterium]
MSDPTILERIVDQRRRDVDADRLATPLDAMQRCADEAPPPIDFAERLRRDAPMAVIAEMKRASPSKGDIAPEIDAAAQALAYAEAGASGISVLTEPTWFKGTLADLRAARQAIEAFGKARPAVLRKDFIIDAYQVFEARAAGADSVLLIVAALDNRSLAELIGCSRGCGMEPLVEVNNADEMRRAIDAGARVIGINNRDLHSFDVDLSTTERLASMVPGGVTLAALSGISSRKDVERFQRAGATAVLVGEALMRADDPRKKIAELQGR